MEISEVLKSNYVKAADLMGRAPTVTIGQAIKEQVGTDTKIVLYFYGKDKGLVCNKTILNTIAKAFGTNTDNWINRQIVLFETMVDFKGESVPAIRVKPVTTAAPPIQPQQATGGNTGGVPAAPAQNPGAGSWAAPPAQPQQQVVRPHMSEMAGAGHDDMRDEIPF